MFVRHSVCAMIIISVYNFDWLLQYRRIDHIWSRSYNATLFECKINDKLVSVNHKLHYILYLYTCACACAGVFVCVHV